MQAHAPDDCLGQVLEADVNELSQLLLTLEPNTMIECYAAGLLAYSRADIHALQDRCTQAASRDDWQICHHLLTLRLAIRLVTNVPSVIKAPEVPDGLWRAELCFVEAMHDEVQGNDVRAEQLYLEAQRQFHRLGIARKAAKSYHNAIACKSRVAPDRRLINEYQAAANLAREAGDVLTTAAALNNLSREFHLIKADRVALQYANESLELLRASAYGTYNFYATLCHRCQLHLELEHVAAAALDYEEASAAEFPEIQSSLQILERWMTAEGIFSDVLNTRLNKPGHLLPSWQEREASGLGGKPDEFSLSALETRVLLALATEARDKFDLIKILWNDQGNFFDLENRLKQLMYRLRKKRPHVVEFFDGKYHLTDKLAVPTIKTHCVI